MINAIGEVFGWIMYGCFKVVKDYGFSIVVFTLLSKFIMLPISIMVQKNSIKMVKMYPEMNRIKAKYFGSSDLISEEQYQLYKRENYHPMLDLLPVVLQLIILMGVVTVIGNPAEYLLRTTAEQAAGLDMYFCGLDLSVVPSQTGGVSIVVPILAALSAWLMCYAQNKANVLQVEQSKANQISTLLLSVGLSLYLGFFVAAGVGLYWIVGNLLSIVQLYLLNAWINPKKYIDYEELEASKKELDKVKQYSSSNKASQSKEDALREKQDYKRFMKYGEKQIVFYSEKNGFYKYFKSVIEIILRKTDIVIHYITSDPKDEVFALANDNFRVYYIGENKLIVLMMKMEADIVCMTMPDLQKYHIKRSMVKNDIEYVYIDHGIGSVNMMLRKHALDYFDTIFASNELAYQEIRAMEKTYNLKEKHLVKWGSGLIDNMIVAYNQREKTENEKKTILIAPSWQDGNLLDLCIEPILEQILKKDYHVILRPHPQYVRHFEEKLLALKERYKGYDNFELQLDFSSNDTVFNADVLMTDWSGIGYEYSFTTLKPTLFINTPMKVMNPDYEEIGVVPFDIEIRDQVGISVETDNLDTLGDVIDRLLDDKEYSKEAMAVVRDKYLYNVSKSGPIGADYLIGKLIEYSKR